MKYIIELPEEVKEKFDNATKDDIYGSYYDYNSVIGNAIKNSTRLEEELEKIKAEIENMWIKSAKDLRTGEVIYENLCEHSEVLEILEKHIEELKGE